MAKKSAFELRFDDMTLLESDGVFDEVNDAMVNEFPYPKDWMIRSLAVLATKEGVAEFVLNFYSNKSIFIIEYEPSQMDIYFNNDLGALMFWSQEAGWGVPQPHPELVKRRMVFWKHFWETGIIDSDYLDKYYGSREHIAETRE